MTGRNDRFIGRADAAGRGSYLVLAIVLIALTPRTAGAQQQIDDVLSFLLTNRSIPTDDFVQDQQVAAATGDAISESLLTGLATLPVSASASGFTYRLDRSLGGVASRSSDSFGPFFTERSLTVGRRHGALGVTFQRTAFDTIDGRHLTDGMLVGTASTLTNEQQPFDVETIALRIQTSVATVSGFYGVSDRLDVGVAIPFVRLSMRGQRVDTYRGRPLLQASAAASASGMGDMALRVKYNLLRGPDGGVAIAADTRLPTGSEEDLLGGGKASFRPRVIWSLERTRVAVDGNAGYSFGGLSGELMYGGAVTIIAAPRVMLIGELAGSRLQSVGRLTETTAPHPRLAGIQTIRLSAVEGASQRVTAVGGIKWNPAATWLIGVNLLRRLTTAGLTASWVPAVAVEYSFGR